MISHPLSVLVAIVLFFCSMFALAYIAERHTAFQKWLHHPLVHVFSLLAYMSAWSFFGALDISISHGYFFLLSFVGASLTFILTPIVIMPLFRITQTYQLSSIADLFSFRYRSQMTGPLITLLSFLISIPMIAIQLHAMSWIIHKMNLPIPIPLIAAFLGIVLTLFASTFGTRHASSRHRHDGLLAVIATQSVIKLLCFIMVTAILIMMILKQPGFANHLNTTSEVPLSYALLPAEDNTWQILLLGFFSATFLSPHMFYLLFSENASEKSINLSSWIVPACFLVTALSIAMLNWGFRHLGLTIIDDFALSTLINTFQSPGLHYLTLLVILSAGSSVIILSTISLASMFQNHILLPMIQLPDNLRFYSWLRWSRRTLIIMVILISYWFFTLFNDSLSQVQTGIVSVVGFLQFLPGVIATLYWQKASRFGFLLGLSLGFVIWFFAVLSGQGTSGSTEISITHQLYTLSWWAILSLAANSLGLIVGSLLSPSTEDEELAATACILNSLPNPNLLSEPGDDSVDSITDRISVRLGSSSAKREIERALKQLKISTKQRLSSLDILRLRNILENNLSGLLGPAEATALVRPQSLRNKLGFQASETHLLEEQLETYTLRLYGLAAELDKIRRYHRAVLQNLPIGVCTLNEQQRIVFWNQSLEDYTHIDSDTALGLRPAELPLPWSYIIADFSVKRINYQSGIKVEQGASFKWFNLQKNDFDTGQQSQIILVEDDTEHRIMENKMAHNERLSSIGRFAAGVAHEIGNPLTGIACLAQNLKLETSQPEVLEAGKDIIEQTKRISNIVDSLMRFAHTGQQESVDLLHPLSLNDCILEAVSMMRFDIDHRAIVIETQLEDSLISSGDEQLLLQVFVNLIKNACDASPDHTRVTIEAKTVEFNIEIRITDQGMGISESNLEHIFDPFFTTKEPGRGTGLGLSLVYNIITEHCGIIELISPVNKKDKKGTQVIIQLPIWSNSHSFSVSTDLDGPN